MLEFSLRQERVKYAKLAAGNSNIGNTDIIGSILQKANLNTNLYEKIAKRRAKAQRPLLLKFLQEIGYEDIFNTEEINEIKALYERAQEEMKENINNPNYEQQLEERLLSDQSLKKELNFEERKGDLDQSAIRSQAFTSGNDEIVVKKEYLPKYTLKSHMDIVRGLLFVPEIDSLASISEDCTLKLWSLKNLEKQYSESGGNPEPYITIRGHTGPLFSCAGPHNTYSKVIFTAGNEGIIRVFNLPSLNEVNQYGDTYDGNSYCIGSWADTSGEAFWDIKHHPFSNILLSINASSQITTWNTNDIQVDNLDNHEKVLNKFNFAGTQQKNLYQHQDQPTSCSWLESSTQNFIVGFRSSTVAVFDSQTGQSTQNLHLTQQNSSTPYSNQINQLVSSNMLNQVAIAQENGSATLYDFKSNKIIKTLQTHHDSVSSLSYSQSGMSLITGSHDGSIKIWDLRNYKQVGEVAQAHSKKYDESVMCIALHNKIPFFASGGADCVINIFELNA